MQRPHGGDIWNIARGLDIPPEKIIDFSASINPLGPPARIKKYLKNISTYPDRNPSLLVKTFADFHSVPPSCVLPGNGSTEFIYLIPQVFKPRKALIVEPAFCEYRYTLKLHGCRVRGLVSSERNAFVPDISTIMKHLRDGYDLLYIANPANPTGTVVPVDTLVDVVRCARRYGTLVVVDEAFCDFTESLSLKGYPGKFKNLVVLRSMTKFYSLAGLRLGFAVAHPDVVERLKKYQPTWSVNTIAQCVGREVLLDGTFIETSLRWFAREQPLLFKHLSSIKGIMVFPSRANFFTVKILRDGLTAMGLKKDLLQDGILVRGLEDFRGLGSRFFRVAVRKRKENALLVERLRRIVDDM